MMFGKQSVEARIEQVAKFVQTKPESDLLHQELRGFGQVIAGLTIQDVLREYIAACPTAPLKNLPPASAVFDDPPENTFDKLEQIFQHDYNVDVTSTLVEEEEDTGALPDSISKLETNLDQLELDSTPDLTTFLNADVTGNTHDVNDNFEAGKLPSNAPTEDISLHKPHRAGRASPSVVCDGFGTIPNDKVASCEKTVREKSVRGNKQKWMSRDGSSVAKANVSVWEVVRGMVEEVEGLGLTISKADYKLHELLKHGHKMVVYMDEKQKEACLGGIESQLELDIDSKPIPRAATTAANDCLNQLKQKVANFDATWNNLRGESEENFRKQWGEMTSLRTQIKEENDDDAVLKLTGSAPSLNVKKATWSDVTNLYCRLVNPFDVYGSAPETWNWLTNPVVLKTQMPTPATDGSKHPFVNPLSVMSDATLEDALPPCLLKLYLLDNTATEARTPTVPGVTNVTQPQSLALQRPNSKSHAPEAKPEAQTVTENEPIRPKHRGGRTGRPRGRPPNTSGSSSKQGLGQQQVQLQTRKTSAEKKAASLVAATLSSYFDNIAQGDNEFEDYLRGARSEANTLIEERDFYVVHQLEQLLALDFNLVFVDKSKKRMPTPDTNEHAQICQQPDTIHRAKIVSALISSCVGTRPQFEAIAKRSGFKKAASSYQRWGPFLCVCKKEHLLDWYLALDSVLQDLFVCGYWGNEADRSLIRSYFTTENLYTSHACVHVIVMSYGTFLEDLAYLKNIHWQLLVMDEPWGLISNSKYSQAMDAVCSIPCRQRLLCCSSLMRTTTREVPSLRHTLSLLFPPVLDLLATEDSPETLDDRSRVLLRRLVGALTVVYDEMIDLQPRDTVLVDLKEIMHAIPLMEWMCACTEIITGGDPQALTDTHTTESAHDRIYKLYRYKESCGYEDEDLDNELRPLVMDTIGQVNVKKRKLVAPKKTQARVRKGESTKGKKRAKIEAVKGSVSVEMADTGNKDDSVLLKHLSLPENSVENVRVCEETSDSAVKQEPAVQMKTENLNGHEPDSDFVVRESNLSNPTLHTIPVGSKSKRVPSSSYRGVSRRSKRWQAQISLNGKNHHLGMFQTEKDAASAYVHAVIEMYAHEAMLGCAAGRIQLRKVMYTGFPELAVEISVRDLTDAQILSRLRKKRYLMALEPLSNLLVTDNLIGDDAQAFRVLPGHDVDENPIAYAKLWGPNTVCYYVKKVKTILGRALPPYEKAAKKLCCALPHGVQCGSLHCHVTSDGSVDYEHCIIEWDSSSRTFTLKCLTSTGKVWINQQRVYCTDPPVQLKTQSVIQLGSMSYYFLLPKDPNKDKPPRYLPLEEHKQMLSASLAASINRHSLANEALLRRDSEFGPSKASTDIDEGPINAVHAEIRPKQLNKAAKRPRDLPAQFPSATYINRHTSPNANTNNNQPEYPYKHSRLDSEQLPPHTYIHTPAHVHIHGSAGSSPKSDERDDHSPRERVSASVPPSRGMAILEMLGNAHRAGQTVPAPISSDGVIREGGLDRFSHLRGSTSHTANTRPHHPADRSADVASYLSALMMDPMNRRAERSISGNGYSNVMEGWPQVRNIGGLVFQTNQLQAQAAQVELFRSLGTIPHMQPHPPQAHLPTDISRIMGALQPGPFDNLQSHLNLLSHNPQALSALSMVHRPVAPNPNPNLNTHPHPHPHLPQPLPLLTSMHAPRQTNALEEGPGYSSPGMGPLPSRRDRM